MSITHTQHPPCEELLSIIARLELPRIEQVEGHDIYAVSSTWKFAQLRSEEHLTVVETIGQLAQALLDADAQSLAIPTRTIGLEALKSALASSNGEQVVFMEVTSE